MKRVLVALVCGVTAALVLGSCARAVAPKRSAPPQRVVFTAGPANTFLAAKALYGKRLYRVTQSPAFMGDAQVGLYIGGVEPTGSEPFLMLDVFSHEYPGQDVYSVNYSVRKTGTEHSGTLALVGYRWETRKGTVVRSIGSGSISNPVSTLMPVGTASHVDSRTIAAVAAGTGAVPTFK